jgi:L-alanine-DL-glutamate epimerase-like enolase superfamily enzyme
MLKIKKIMKISNVEVYLIPIPWKGWVFVRVLTSDGEEGVGEATHYFGQRAVKSMYRDVREFVLGKDPLEVEKLWYQMFKETGNPSKDVTKISLMSEKDKQELKRILQQMGIIKS